MFELRSWLGVAIAVVVALIAASVIALIVSAVLRRIARRRDWPKTLSATVRRPFRGVLLVIGLWVVYAVTWPAQEWSAVVVHTLVIVTIAVSAWFVAAVLAFGIGVAMARLPLDLRDNRVARRRQTQLTLIRRLLIVVVAIIALGAILITFPAIAALGTSILASAGVAGIVAGLAAQSTLASVFAGIQLAFSDAIRVDDVVVVEDEWGRIEEITLTYVVVHIWDDRRLVLPSTYFTSTPFENWTRRSSELLGSVEFDLDWRASPSQMRAELDRILARTDLWDGRTNVLQVTDAVGGAVRVRILVTAVDAPTLFDLRCFIREEFVEWLHREKSALPLSRVQLVAEPAHEPRRLREADGHGGLFTGSAEGEERAGQFTGAIPIVDEADAAGQIR
ncbi:mechanosensitive ion channel family protein [Microbacterium terricola]|uniref:Mechanosensitive ion channel protein MscS n=1 Tax=Microbacterium terricola TaxID=344163 RepID=A0ABM8DVJ8_9MICO|nr:mechanosensitive ion channel family protein [Microbacterium terricola]UYK39793.1 mechanosensitive ion channel family protein [Microbacterium terricola]BDV29456.1 mechanosensitive ion channel protein MscS [Microbacterium terricola]